MRGDVILEFDDEKVEDPYDLSLYVGNTEPGKEAKIEVLRSGEKKEFKVKIGQQEAKAGHPGKPGKERAAPGKSDKLGLVVKTIAPQDARRLDVPSSFKGIVVGRVEPGSAGERADVRPGDVILEINDTKIQNIGDYEAAVKELKEGGLVRLFIKRGQASVYLAFRL
jgi:serine protease Do